jgi:hypothetical protein
VGSGAGAGGAAALTGAGSGAGVAAGFAGAGADAGVVALAVVVAGAGVAVVFAGGVDVVGFAGDCANAASDRFKASAAITQFRMTLRISIT